MSTEKLRPDDEQFRVHFKNLLNPSQVRDIDKSFDIGSVPSIPVLDDPFTPQELTSVISNMKKE